MSTSADYCGCCGAVCGPGRVWCVRCQQHIAPVAGGLHLWDRTYFARHGQPCPFEPKAPA